MIPDLFLSLLIWIGATLLAAGIVYVIGMGIWAIWAGRNGGGDAELKAEINRLTGIIDDPKLAAIHFDGRMLELGLRGSAAQILAHTFAEQFKREGATNYLEISFVHDELGPFTVTLQRVLGETPTQKLKKAEEDRDAILGDAAIGAAVNLAARELPSGWAIEITIKRGDAWVDLTSPFDWDVELNVGGLPIDGQIHAAIVASKSNDP